MLDPAIALRALEAQLAALAGLKGRKSSDAEDDEREWEQLTQSIIERAFGKDSSNVSKFHSARWAGSHTVRDVYDYPDDSQDQINYDLRQRAFGALLRALIAELKLLIPTEIHARHRGGHAELLEVQKPAAISVNVPSAIISYTQDSEPHKELVLQLAQELRAHGIDCVIDRFVDPVDWALWMETEVRERQWVLVVASPAYLSRSRNTEEPGRGLGGSWEYASVRQILYESRNGNPKFIPVVFGPENVEYIPDALRGRTRYDATNADDRNRLVNKLAGLPITVGPAPLGALAVRAVVSAGISPEDSATNASTLPQANAAIRPRLHLKVTTNEPPALAISGGPMAVGDYRLNLELSNKGKGPANKVRLAITGMAGVKRLGTIAEGDPPLKFDWELKGEKAHTTAQDEPAITVEYADDDGVVYHQVGPLQVKSVYRGFGYSGGNLEAPERVDGFTIT
jgi:DNA-binding transcriptional LysR family regulator